MEERIKHLQDQLQRQEKLAQLGMLAAGIAHEVQNPLNFVMNFAKMSKKLASDLINILNDYKDQIDANDWADVEDILADLSANMDKVGQHGQRATDIIQGVLMQSRGKEGVRVPSDLVRLTHEYVWLAYHAMRAGTQGFNVSIVENLPSEPLIMEVIPQDFTRAILNLMNNACYAVWAKQQTASADYAPTITISLAKEDAHIRLTITDNGEGMTAEVQQHLYENFFTTKPQGKGTGLGMAITRDIIEQRHAGHLSFQSTPGEGTTFCIELNVRN